MRVERKEKRLWRFEEVSNLTTDAGTWRSSKTLIRPFAVMPNEPLTAMT
jgi:hypothetical protein